MERYMRRFRQELSQEDVLRILNNGKVAVVAVAGDRNYPYAVPINYVHHNGYVYFHSAAQGHKVDALKYNPKCSLCIVDKDDVVPEEFTSYFRSVIAFGTADFLEDEADKIFALRLLCEKYSNGIDPTAEINKFLNVVSIIRIKIEKATGKEAIELVRQRQS